MFADNVCAGLIVKAARGLMNTAKHNSTRDVMVVVDFIVGAVIEGWM